MKQNDKIHLALLCWFWPVLCQKWFLQTWTFPSLFYLFIYLHFISLWNWQRYKEKLFLCRSLNVHLFSIWKLSFFHKHKSIDKGKSTHWQSYRLGYYGRSLINDQTRVSHNGFKIFTADHSHSESFNESYNVSHFYKNMYTSSQKSEYLSIFTTFLKYI